MLKVLPNSGIKSYLYLHHIKKLFAAFNYIQLSVTSQKQREELTKRSTKSRKNYEKRKYHKLIQKPVKDLRWSFLQKQFCQKDLT